MVGEEQFLEIAGGDPGLAKLLRESLTVLEDGAGGPVLQELARDVLTGQVDLRQVARSDGYADAFREAIRDYEQWREEAGPKEVARRAAAAAAAAAAESEEAGRPGTGTRPS